LGKHIFYKKVLWSFRIVEWINGNNVEQMKIIRLGKFHIVS